MKPVEISILAYPAWDPCQNIAMTFGMEKLECGYTMVKSFEDKQESLDPDLIILIMSDIQPISLLKKPRNVLCTSLVSFNTQHN